MVTKGTVVKLAVDRKPRVVLVLERADRGRRTFDVALDLARRLDASVVVQGIVERSVGRAGPWEVPRVAEVRAGVDGALEGLGAAGRPARGEVSIVQRGGAADAIAELAEDASADLIVLAGARFPRLAALVGASTAEQVEGRTSRPLLVVPPGRRGRSGDGAATGWRPALV